MDPHAYVVFPRLLIVLSHGRGNLALCLLVLEATMRVMCAQALGSPAVGLRTETSRE